MNRVTNWRQPTCSLSERLLPRPNVLRNVCEVPDEPVWPRVKVHVLQAFYGNRQLLKVGETVELAQPDAESAVALKRAEYL